MSVWVYVYMQVGVCMATVWVYVCMATMWVYVWSTGLTRLDSCTPLPRGVLSPAVRRE